jgi:TPR repeat protein
MVREGGGAKSSGRIGTDGRFCRERSRGPKDTAAAKAYYEKAAALGNDSAKTALKRVECPYVIKDKNGKFVTNLCF